MSDAVTLPKAAATEDARAARIRSQCERILADSVFRGSKRSSDFLLHTVNCALEGSLDRLKERSIGIDLFGRPPDYDTGEDSIVRVAANEVRKKLAQYYVERGHESEIRIALRSGSYVPEFHLEPEVPDTAQAPARGFSLRVWLTAGLGLTALIAVLVMQPWQRPSANTTLERFWAPIVNSTKPVIICSSSPNLYLLTAGVRQKYFGTQSSVFPFGAGYGSLPPDATVRGGDVIYLPGRFVGIGDAVAAAKLHAFFSARKKPSRIEIGDKTSFSELRQASVVLVGGYKTNKWTFPMTSELRFAFQTKGRELQVVDTAVAGRRWVLPAFSLGEDVQEDYAVVSRLFDAKSGGTLVAGAGITQYGTQAAGEFLTSEALLGEALRNAPADWEKRNIQIVLHTSVIDRTPAPPKVLAVHFR